MTQQQAESVKDLAKPVVEALKRVAEKECSKCNGLGWTPDAKLAGSSNIKCTKCSGTGKLSWKWEPKERDEFLVGLGGKWQRRFITMVGSGRLLDQYFNFHPTAKVIPILPWEEIERVLKGVGYYLKLNHYDQENESAFVARFDREKTNEFIPEHELPCKSRQEAVMLAVIKLGEEKNDKVKCAD